MIPNFLLSVCKNPVVVLGNQKSGTSVIASLLAERAGVSSTIDTPVLWEPNLTKLLKKEVSLKEIINENRKPFTRKVIKEPNLTFFANELPEMFPHAKYLFVIRDPRDNIRSILNRLEIRGDLESLESKNQIPGAWLSLFNHYFSDSEHYIEKLAYRWKFCAEEYFSAEDKYELVKYEDFLNDKVVTIDSLCEKLGLKVKHSIDHLLDRQFQPKGNHSVTWDAFFGEENLAFINDICEPLCKEFGYV